MFFCLGPTFRPFFKGPATRRCGDPQKVSPPGRHTKYIIYVALHPETLGINADFNSETLVTDFDIHESVRCGFDVDVFYSGQN